MPSPSRPSTNQVPYVGDFPRLVDPIADQAPASPEDPFAQDLLASLQQSNRGTGISAPRRRLLGIAAAAACLVGVLAIAQPINDVKGDRDTLLITIEPAIGAFSSIHAF